MRTMKHWALAAAAAAALALAGCGGGGSSSSTSGGGGSGSTESKSALSYATDLDNSVDTLMTLAGAVDADGSALMMAKKYADMLGTLKSGGNSATEMMNAAMVLKAKSDLEAAIMAAKEDKMEAEAAKAETEDETVIEALNNAIMAADTQITAAQKILDATGTDSLASYVEMVTGTDEDDMMTAADKGKEVADAIHTALTTTAQVPATSAVSAFTDVPTATSATVGKVMAGPSDAQGMTWAEIGGSSLMDMRIATGAPSGSSTTAVKAKSVAGMTAEKLGQTTSPATADGTEVTGASYKGITGTLFCAGSDCDVENVEEGTFAAATSKLTGSWYFAPSASSMTTYLAGTGAAAGTYLVEDPTNATRGYVRYGYWLSTSGTPVVTTINRYLFGPAAQTGDVYNVVPAVDAFAGQSASYEGDAVGMSVAWTTDTSGNEVAGSRASGHFDADVSLTMTFGGSQTLEGMISNFRGDGVDTGWEVKLKSSTLASGVLGTAATDGTVGADATSGSWTATAWGGAASDPAATPNPAARPAGVYGEFSAGFPNGAAAGVYATRKQ